MKESFVVTVISSRVECYLTPGAFRQKYPTDQFTVVSNALVLNIKKTPFRFVFFPNVDKAQLKRNDWGLFDWILRLSTVRAWESDYNFAILPNRGIRLWECVYTTNAIRRHVIIILKIFI